MGGCCSIAIPNIFPFILNVMIIFIFLLKDACLDVLCITLTGLRSLSWFSFIAGYKAGQKKVLVLLGETKSSHILGHADCYITETN